MYVLKREKKQFILGGHQYRGFHQVIDNTLNELNVVFLKIVFFLKRKRK